MHVIRISTAIFSILFVAVSAHAAGPVSVTACGQSYAGEGSLVADLDCSGYAGDAVSIKKGSLDLAGFTLTAGLQHGIVCEGRCSVDGGGGSVVGAGIDGIHNAGRRLAVSDLTISLSGRNGIGAPGTLPYAVKRSHVTVSGSTISNSAERGINSRKASVSNSTISGNGLSGLYIARNLDITDSDVSANGNYGIYSEGKVLVDGCTVNSNSRTGARGIRGLRVSASDVSGNGRNGLECRKILVTLSTVNNNDLYGAVSSRHVTSSDSTICGNSAGDLYLVTEPKISLTTTQCAGHPDCLPCL